MRAPPWVSLILAPLIALPSACTKPAGAASDRDAAAAAPLVEELRIGAVDGGPAAFGRVMAVEADAVGNVYVADGLANEIRVFGPDGTHLRSFGREGGGPGEFRMLTGMAWEAGRWLRVMDAVALRLSTFDTAGRFHGAQVREFSRALTIPWQGMVDVHGRIYDMVALPGAAGSGVPRRGIVRYRADGERLVGIDTVPLPVSEVETVENRRRPGLIERVTIPFAPGVRWGLAPDGTVWVGNSSSYDLARITFAGDTVARLTHRRAAVPVTRAARDSAASADGVPADRIPAYMPAFEHFFVDDEGRVWVAPTQGSSGTTWDIFAPTGEHLATLHTPLDIEPVHPSPVVRAGALYGTIRDELDVVYVVRLRVPLIS